VREGFLDLYPAVSTHTVRVRTLVGMLVLLASLSLGTDRALAVSKAGDPPIYNPASKSYFQLLKATGRLNNWLTVRGQAMAQTFNGVQGRLAVIDSAETHEFIMKSFNVSKPIWVGLRYWCEFRMLEWYGQRPYSPSDPGHFQAWHSQWNRGNQLCAHGSSGPNAFMGVYYQPVGKQSARWQAARRGKGFGLLLVEFPTGDK